MTNTSIAIRRAASAVVPTLGVLAVAVAALPAPAVAEPLPYGPDTQRVVFSAFGDGEVFGIVTGRYDPGPGCSISIDGEVVAFEPIGGSGHCIYTFP